MQRALEQMAEMTRSWGDRAGARADITLAEQWWCLGRAIGSEADERLDPYLTGEAWWDLVRPLFANLRSDRRRRRYTRLRDHLDPLLHSQPLELPGFRDALRRVPAIEPVDKRVAAAIIGVPQ